MLKRLANVLSIALAYTSVTLVTTSAYGQSPAQPASPNDRIQAPQGLGLSDPKKAVVAKGRRADDLENTVMEVKAENAALKEQLRKLDEQQKAMLEQFQLLRQRLEGSTIAGDAGPETAPDGTSAADPAAVPSTSPADPEAPSTPAPEASAPSSSDSPTPEASAPSPSDSPAPEAPVPPPTDSPAPAKSTLADRYQDGIVIWKSPAEARIPVLLRFNVNTQIRYLNTTSSPDTFTDHLGVVREVHTRNDITVNRTMFILGGYVFDTRLRYSMTVWTSAGAASIVVAGNIGWQFNQAFTLTGGYTGVPGTRSLVNTFPFFTSTDRTMADNFFRPGFTQGIWANGEPLKGLNYLVFVGNGLNTLNISANKIDTHLLYSGSVWWEPLGDYGPPGKSRNMYDDYFASKDARIRVGTAYTRSREDRFTNLDQSSPENTSLYNSDGVLTFSTGAFAPGVTVEEATYRLWAVDGGIKWNGLAVNGQYFRRWIDDFDADGPLPLASTLDYGFELSASYFVIPKKLLVYGRGSKVYGEFGDSWEYAGGVKWHPLSTERFWVNAEVMDVHKVPYSGAFTPYTAGLDGWVPMIQSVLAF